MDDRYRSHVDRESAVPQSHPMSEGAAPERTPGDRAAGALLWAVFAMCVGLNAALSVAKPDEVALSAAFGVLALLCIAVLVVRYLNRRRS